MKRIKQMLMGIFLAVVGMPLLVTDTDHRIGLLLALLGLGFAVVGFMLDEND